MTVATPRSDAARGCTAPATPFNSTKQGSNDAMATGLREVLSLHFFFFFSASLCDSDAWRTLQDGAGASATRQEGTTGEKHDAASPCKRSSVSTLCTLSFPYREGAIISAVGGFKGGTKKKRGARKCGHDKVCQACNPVP